MKKVIFALCAVALLFTSCYQETGTVIVKYSIVDENGQTIDNMLGFNQHVFTAMNATFTEAGYTSASFTYSGGELLSPQGMSFANAKKEVITLTDKAVADAKADAMEKYPYPSDKTFTFRVKYRIATQDIDSNYDVLIPTDYYAEPN